MIHPMIHRSPFLDQKCNNILLTGRGCRVESCLAFRILSIKVGAGYCNNVPVTLRGCHVKGSQAAMQEIILFPQRSIHAAVTHAAIISVLSVGSHAVASRGAGWG